MVRSLSQANRVFSFASNALSFPMYRRGYATGCDSSIRGYDRIGSRSGIMGKIEETSGAKNGFDASASTWVPDPVTGYYRPINNTHEIDPVELRQMLLNHKTRSS
ncbi:hypothetical protein TanjilG_06785 [Lupinus angustifolius]|uniref:Late embryogenesis abundant protein Lea5 n=1 Tax=Lupinus angustifolius TaxID=3871 RepID=A0A394DP84_LUPAN|nr:PREDICTED: late embryogenesis abundant protein Lea5-like [Lupinus angustifolius]OIW21627.1 hypothetical protein TanjilG_06785 [Lupinus angustifolius]